MIVPDITFLATANAPYLNGASIIFCDVDEKLDNSDELDWADVDETYCL